MLCGKFLAGDSVYVWIGEKNTQKDLSQKQG